MSSKRFYFRTEEQEGADTVQESSAPSGCHFLVEVALRAPEEARSGFPKGRRTQSE